MAARRSGTIVNIGSVVGEITTPWGGVYAATKAAEQAIFDTLWMECRPFNVSIMHVSSGGVISNIAQNMISRFSLLSDSLYIPCLNITVERINRN
ncbi:uncharacterized protein FIBRA_06233 [Fibroporia radiculosa]|uniref:Ketoreductase (KR) domain-containing protein n=1 Tax=Fibroporia radiculosa TaxID=599839 RepID=J4H3Y9_9APHY|nr:uncharacterized protein FIBRA_06233 [Fibroporia radiculosa]CCM04074.1 predicted protein [Fibroporia radiculosa]